MADKREEKKKEEGTHSGHFRPDEAGLPDDQEIRPEYRLDSNSVGFGYPLVFLLIGIALNNWITFPDSGSGRCRYRGDASAGSARADCSFCSD